MPDLKSAYLEEIQRQVAESTNSASRLIQEQLAKINEAVRQSCIDISSGIANQLQETNKLFVEGAKRYKIAEDKAAIILSKYKWLVSPGLPVPIVFELMQIGIKPGRQDKAINKLFFDYFSLNSWLNLEIMAREWKGLIRKERLDIIKDCIYMLQQTQDNKINQTNVILPTIIAQIEGVWEDYLKGKGVTYTGGKDRKDKFKKFKRIVIPDKLDVIAENIFLDILFQKSFKGRKLEKPFNFNRHKILHGENIRYGRKDYLIRAFLILDFLAHLV